MLSSSHLQRCHPHHHLTLSPLLGQEKTIFPKYAKYGKNVPKHITHTPKVSISSKPVTSERTSLSAFSPLEAFLFDMDGTLCDSDPLFFYTFREMLLEADYNGGVPIDEEFYIKKIAGKHNGELIETLFPHWDLDDGVKFINKKDATFRRLATEQLKPVKGIYRLCKWIEERGLKRCLVTNAPRANVEHLISMLELKDFFQSCIVIGPECDRQKPFPDPYLKGLELLNVSAEHSLAVEDSAPGIRAGVAAGMPVLGVATRNPALSLMDAGATVLINDYDDTRLWSELGSLETKAAKLTGIF